MMRRFLQKVSVAATSWAAVIAVGSFSAAMATTIEGTFNTGQSEMENSGGGALEVKFHPCADDPQLSCGTVVRIVDQADPNEPAVMPDGSDLLGFVMVTGLKHKGDGQYRGGKINAVDESIDKGEMAWYGVKVDVLDDGRLKLKGCVGFVCPRTLYWAPVEDAEPSQSAMAGDATLSAALGGRRFGGRRFGPIGAAQ